MKTIVKNLVLSGFIFLGSAGIMGQQNLILEDVKPLMACSTDMKCDITISAENTLDSYQLYIEERIQVKDWMLNRADWMMKDESILASATRPGKEAELQMEDWMIRNFLPEEHRLTNLVKEEKESPLVLQDWMLCCKEWQAGNF
jgi:hypothetical protein